MDRLPPNPWDWDIACWCLGSSGSKLRRTWEKGGGGMRALADLEI
jgi:hypothetical protein